MEKQTPTTKQEVRAYAIEYQNWASDQNLSYEEISKWHVIFRELADRFNLRDEFEENGII